MRVTANDFTHIGQGEENQDRVRVLTSQDGDASLLVLADGLGGHSGAALGAETVVETADRLWGERAGSSDDEEFLRKLALESHAAVNRIGHEHGKDSRSTLAALLLNGSEAVSVHAGDSRVMQLSGDRMVKRTLDHSIGQLSVLRGAITEEQLATHPDQKKLFAHIGGEAEPDFEINRWNLNEGGRFVVCSDGFWEVFPVDEIHTLFEAADPIRELGTRLEEKLARMEGHDNTSAILAEVHPLPRATWYWVALATLVLIGLAVALWPSSGIEGRPPSIETAGGPEEIRRMQDDTGAFGTGMQFALAAQATTREEGAPSGEPAREGRDDRAGEPSGEDSATSGRAIPNERINLRPDLVIRDSESTPAAVERELRESGRLGDDDALEARSGPRSLAGKTQTRLAQTHKGIPVFAAEIVATLDGKRVISIQGHTSSSIKVDAAPPNDYRRTIALARKSIRSEIETLDGGSLVILAVEGGHRLGWLGLVAIGGVQERVIFDAETGEILFREPATVG